jgi:hypothetical protein
MDTDKNQLLDYIENNVKQIEKLTVNVDELKEQVDHQNVQCDEFQANERELQAALQQRES